jgi:hypothetical protein
VGKRKKRKKKKKNFFNPKLRTVHPGRMPCPSLKEKLSANASLATPNRFLFSSKRRTPNIGFHFKFEWISSDLRVNVIVAGIFEMGLTHVFLHLPLI